MVLLLLACASNASPELPLLAGGEASMKQGAKAAVVPTFTAPDNAGFWASWGDGKAEVSTYTLRQPRYGSIWEGTAVLIFVTEDFSWSERVKADAGQHPATDLRPVLKLNASREFVTGIYPYHTLTSVFGRVDPGDGMRALDPIKVTFSAQEWCGMVYDEWVPESGRVRMTGHTYFDQDGRPPATVQTGQDLLYGDAIPLLVRSLRGDVVAPGGSATFPYLPSLLGLRFAHVAPAIGSVEVSRGPTREVTTPEGASYRVEPWRVAESGGKWATTTTWYVEDAGMRRIVGWESEAGESAWMKASERVPYWELNKPGDEAWRQKLGL